MAATTNSQFNTWILSLMTAAIIGFATMCFVQFGNLQTGQNDIKTDLALIKMQMGIDKDSIKKLNDKVFPISDNKNKKDTGNNYVQCFAKHEDGITVALK